MKKLLLLITCIALSLLLFAACGNGGGEVTEPSGEPAADTCAHEWEFVTFVTAASEVSLPGRYLCKNCQKEETRSISYTDIAIPLVTIDGEIAQISKEEKANVRVIYQSEERSFESAATMKLQGNSSLSWEKKNFALTLRDDAFDKKNKVVVKEAWGAQSKYCLKSNYVDPTFARNLVTSDLYGQIAATRELEDEYSSLANYGSVDGFMVMLYLNGRYQGVYNWNIPKDKWLFDMGDEEAGEAVLCGSANLLYRDGITVDEEAKSYWEFEYCNAAFSEQGESWAVDSFNEMLFFSIDATPTEFREGAANYLNVERTIDAVLLACVFCQKDNINANLVFCTYDGTHWAPVLYDLDETFGRDAGDLVEGKEDFPDCSENPIYSAILRNFYPELKARYFALRESILTTKNIKALFAEKMKGLDERYFRSEAERWERGGWQPISSSGDLTIDSFADELAYIESYIDARLAYCDLILSRETFSAADPDLAA